MNLVRLLLLLWPAHCRGQQLVNDGPIDFTKARLQAIAPGGQILLSFTNRIRLDFAKTWVTHVRGLGMKNYLIGATDTQALDGLRKAHIQCFSMQTNLPQGEWPWGSPSFKALGPHKIELIYKTISWGLEVVITDIDALVLREPFGYMRRWPDAGFLTSSDHLGNTTSDGGLEDHKGIHTAFNIGYMFFRKSALPLVEEWRKVIREQPRSRWDQGEFNRLARFGWNPRVTTGLSDPRLFWSYKKQVIGGVLPLALFCGGHNYFVSQFAQRAGLQPYSIHTTYQYSGAAGKRHRLREAMVWVDEPDYYDPAGGLLTFVPDVPEQLVFPPGGMKTKGHIKLIKHQLRQIRSALSLASALGRKLVLPAVTCGYDKGWYPLSSSGAFPGTHPWAVPIRNCPLDHFLEVGSLSPVQTVREYSFLRNPRVPAAVLASSALTTLDAGAASTEVERLSRSFGAVKVLNVTNLATAPDVSASSSGFLSTMQRSKFAARFGFVHGSWCCAPSAESKSADRPPSAAHFRLMSA